MKSMRAGGMHIRTSGQEIATLFTMDKVVRQLQGHDLYECGYAASGIQKAL